MNIANLSQKLNIRYQFVLCSVLFCGLYFLRDIIGIGISYYIFCAVAGMSVLLLKDEEAIAFLVSICAFSNAGYSGIFALLMLMCILLKFGFLLNKVNVLFFFPIFFCLLEGMHYIVNNGIEMGVVITYVCLLLCLAIISQYPHDKIDKHLVINSFICFSIFFAVMTILQLWIIMGSLGALFERGFRIDEYVELFKESKLIGNANALTSLCSLNMCLCVLMIKFCKKKLRYILAIGFFVVVGLLTISKMFIVVLLLFSLYITYVLVKKNFLRGLGMLLLFTVVGWLLLKLFGDSLIKMVIARFDQGDLTTGRVEIVDTLLAYMNMHPLSYVTGLGILQQYLYIGGQAVHSSFFELLGGWGIIGVALAISYIFLCVRNANKYNKSVNFKAGALNYLPILMLIAYSLIGMLFSSPTALIKMMVAIYAVELKGVQSDAKRDYANI